MDQPYYRLKGGVCAPRGFQANAVSCGIKNPEATRLDLALLTSSHPCLSAGTFTTNRVKAAPVRVTQSHQRSGPLQAIIVNSGNANACTGPQGIADAREMAKLVAKPLGLRHRQVGVCSTGVIGLPLPMERLRARASELVDGLDSKKGHDLACAIITSDTHEKEFAISFDLEGQRVRIGGCAKGAGMIAPSMATMLSFLTTDVALSSAALERATQSAVENTFNRIIVDGDMSTNDTVLVLANGLAKNRPLKRGTKAEATFTHALTFVMNKLAKAIVRDGERVNKFVTLNVVGARTLLDAKKAAEAVATSALVKSSWNGEDPNWGRVIHAVGYSQARIREELIDIYYNQTPACLNGVMAPTDPEALRAIVCQDSFEITIDLNLGEGAYHLYTADLSPEYIDFNRSEYAYWKQHRAEQKEK